MINLRMNQTSRLCQGIISVTLRKVEEKGVCQLSNSYFWLALNNVSSVSSFSMKYFQVLCELNSFEEDGKETYKE